MTTHLTHQTFTPARHKTAHPPSREKLLPLTPKKPLISRRPALYFIRGIETPPNVPYFPSIPPSLRPHPSAMLNLSTFSPASSASSLWQENWEGRLTAFPYQAAQKFAKQVGQAFSLPGFLPQATCQFQSSRRGLSSEIMDVFQLTRTLIDIESVTPNEREIGQFLFDYLNDLAKRFNGKAERLPVEQHRDNVFVRFGAPIVTLSTHMDTVPPFIASSDDGTQIWGRGACDTKGIIAAMLKAAEHLLSAGKRNFGLLFVVGEERNSAGALAAANTPRGSKFIINGEPTENKLALGSKGALRFEIVATGRMAHSAYPELGDSAIEKLLNALQRIRKMPLPVDDTLGPSTLNIGILRGGRAPNVIADEAAAEIFIRVVGDVTELRKQIKAAAAPDAEANEVLFIPAVHLGSLPGFPTTIVAYTTDIPAFGNTWGQPFLVGPGTIHVAHTNDERIAKSDLTAAVEIYAKLVERLSQ